MQEACKAILSGHEMISGLINGSAEGSENSTADSDMEKASKAAREKRLREVEVLRLGAEPA
ncbi:MAG: hypothetical protein E5X75_33675 [Mesorhizobium sp.]|nr:MAG: hypothetical protein E5X75_33675 [Mesorhizobium sp.]